uniref:NADH dehydrogenase [ubiquinone] 1 alpha subcomplex subunit 12 n=1 Tax=Gadus morhua TaxID=8049 RepID=A0A8C5CWH7_GADMO
MAEFVNIARRALGQLGGHGGVKGFLVQLFRANDVKTGALIGVDKYGNKYFEDSKNYFFGRHRWVLYTTEMNGKNTMWEVDGSMVPAEWHRWLHCMTDDPPTTHPPVPRKFLAETHQFNVKDPRVGAPQGPVRGDPHLEEPILLFLLFLLLL